MINIINVGIGNFNSVYSWAKQSGLEVKVLTSPEEYSSGGIIIPGVCSASELMTRIEKRKFKNLILSNYKNGELILGICAGYQILGRYTTEDNGKNCLDLLPFNVSRVVDNNGYDSGCTGWKKVNIVLGKHDRLSKRYPKRKRLKGEAYFNHEYGARIEVHNTHTNDIYDQDNEYSSYFVRNNVIGLQFHPEKSSSFGIDLLRILI